MEILPCLCLYSAHFNPVSHVDFSRFDLRQAYHSHAVRNTYIIGIVIVEIVNQLVEGSNVIITMN